MSDAKDRTEELLNTPPRVINVGLQKFASDLHNEGVEVIDIDWSPPAGGNQELAALLSKLGV